MDRLKIIEAVKTASDFVFDKKLREDVAMKGKADYVTAVDLRISEYIKEILRKIDPDAGFMSEEEKGEIKEKRWILDPIDGTANLVYDYNFSSVSLGYFDGNEVTFGVIYDPYKRELFTAAKGEGVYLNGVKLPKAPDRAPEECLVEFGANSTRKEYTAESFEIGREVFTRCLDIRRGCSSALALAYIAAGRLNGYFEREIKPWDYAAASLMLNESGCIYTDWQGEKIQFERPTSFLCGTPRAYEVISNIIKEKTK